MEKETKKKLEDSLDSLILTYYQRLGIDTVSARKEIFSVFFNRLIKLLINDNLTMEQKSEIKEHIYMKVRDLLGR